MMNNKGTLFVITGPSGAGKGTVLKQVIQSLDQLYFSVSATTRAPREGEVDGVHYHFLTRERFEQLIEADRFLEYARYAENYYGTPLDPVEEHLAQGHDVILEIELQGEEHHDLAAAKVFEGMGIYAPTLGIVGAVLGLIAVMTNLADPSKLGHGIAAAFTATIYGIASANMFFLPMAAKLKSVIGRRSGERELAIEGLIAIAQGENPRNIEARLAGFLH